MLIPSAPARSAPAHRRSASRRAGGPPCRSCITIASCGTTCIGTAKRTCPPSPSPGPRAAHRGSPPHRHALAEVNAPPLAAQPGGTGLVVSLGPTDAFRRARGPVVSGASRRHRKAAWRRGTARRQRSLCRGITGEQRSLCKGVFG
jgi:hypothetical protein